MTSIRQLIEEYAGPRCPDYDPGCVTCQYWAEYDRLTKDVENRELNERMTRIINWMVSLPMEDQWYILTAITYRDHTTVNTAAVQKYAYDHSAEIAKITRDKNAAAATGGKAQALYDEKMAQAERDRRVLKNAKERARRAKK